MWENQSLGAEINLELDASVLGSCELFLRGEGWNGRGPLVADLWNLHPHGQLLCFFCCHLSI